MKIQLREKPAGKPVIIEGFPGFGFVSTIAVEYLVDALEMKSIGRIWSHELSPVAIIHQKDILQPMEIYYSKKYNLVVLETLANVQGLEWDIADAVMYIYKKLNAREIVSIEGIAAPEGATGGDNVYYFTSGPSAKKLEAIGLKQLKEGIVFGVTGALMIKSENAPVNTTYLFGETHSQLPDSKAAARIVEVLDQYLKLNIDVGPLMKKAAQFEQKLAGLIEQSKKATKLKEEKDQGQPYQPYIS